MNKQRFWPRAAGALAIIALVLVTNEGYRRVRGLIDTVDQSKQDIALLKRDLYVLQVQLDTGAMAPAGPAIATPVTAVPASPAPAAVVATPYPMPAPIGPGLALPETPARPRPKPQPSDEPKSMVNVVLLSDEKPAPAAAAGVKSQDVAKMDVKLIGDAK